MKSAKYIDHKKYTVELMALKTIYKKILEFAESEKACHDAGYDLYKKELREFCGAPYNHYVIGYSEPSDGGHNGIIIDFVKMHNHTKTYTIQIVIFGRLFIDYLREITSEYYPDLTSTDDMPLEAWEVLSGKAQEAEILNGYITAEYEDSEEDPEYFEPLEIIDHMRLRIEFTHMFPMGGVLYDTDLRLDTKKFTLKSITKFRDMIDTIIKGLKQRDVNVRIQSND